MKIFIALTLLVVACICWWMLAGKTNSRIEADGNGKPILRQFADLTPNDFKEHPVWVHCHVIDYDKPWYKETNEETFRPWNEAVPVDAAKTIYLVRATFRLADGTSLGGFLTPQSKQENQGKPDLGTIQPQLFLPSGKRVPFWFGVMAPTKQEIAALYSSLKKSEKDIFPIIFSADQGLATGLTSGSIFGFYSIKEDKTVSVEK